MSLRPSSDSAHQLPPLTLLLAALLLAVAAVMLTLDALNEASQGRVFAAALMGAAILAVVAARRLSMRPTPLAFFLALAPAALLLWRGLWLLHRASRTEAGSHTFAAAMVLLIVPALLLLATLVRLVHESRRSV